MSDRFDPLEDAEGQPHPTTPSEWFECWEPVIQKAATMEHKSSCLFDKEDMAQAVRLWFLGELHKDEIMQAEKKFVQFLAFRAARVYAVKERVDWDFFTGSFTYTPAIVEEALAQGIWEQGPEGDWDLRLDVRKAWRALKPRSRDLIFRRHAKGDSLTETEMRATRRAHVAMARWLNDRVEKTVVEVTSPGVEV